jgi:phosphoglycolate phosphatase
LVSDFIEFHRIPPPFTAVAVIFDFDGTLANSRDAAWAAFQRVDTQLGLGIGSAEAFYDLFADSFHAALARACGEELAAKAWKEYSAILESEYSPQLVPGMAGVVRDLAQESPLAVMSANTIAVVRRALEDAGIATCFGQAFCG